MAELSTTIVATNTPNPSNYHNSTNSTLVSNNKTLLQINNNSQL